MKISALPVATTPLTGAEIVPLDQSGQTRQTTMNDVAVGPLVQGLISSMIGGALTNTRLAKTGTYSVVNGDKGKTIALGGSSFYTVTFSAASGYDTNFAVILLNEDSGRAKKIVLTGGLTYKLYPGQSTIVYNQSNVWASLGAPYRWRNTTGAGITLFVSTTGSDTNNDGLTAGSPFATIQQAVNTHFFDIDHNNQGPTIQLADGTYIETVSLVRGPFLGYHFVNIVGNTGTPSNVIWEASGSGICLSCRDYGIAVVSGMRFRAAGGGTTNGCIGLLASQWGNIDYSNVDFGAFPNGNQVMVQSGGGINPTGSYSISGSCSAHIYCFGPAHVLTSAGITVTISAITVSSAYIQMPGPGAIVSIDPSMTFSGAGAGAGTTGAKFSVHPRSDLQLNGVTLPGATAGGYLSGPGILSNGSWPQGYATGSGGTVTQATSKSTAVTLNTLTGAITVNAAALAAGTVVSFTLNNTTIAATDFIGAMHENNGSIGSYTINARATGAGTAAIDIRNNTAGSLAETLVIRFMVQKSVNS